MLDLRAEFRQSPGDVKPRNVRGRCQKTTTSRRADCGEHRQVAGALAGAPRLTVSELVSHVYNVG